MRSLLALLLILACWTSPAGSETFMLIGAETGVVTGKTGEFYDVDSNLLCETGTITADTTTVRSGAYSLKVASGGRVMSRHGHGVASTNNGYIRGYVNMAACPSVDTPVWETATDTSCDDRLFALWVKTDCTLAWTYQDGSYIASSSATLPLNEWVRVETHVKQHASTGGMELKLNGAIAFTSFGTNTAVANTYWIGFGPRAGGGQAIYYDDIRVDDAAYPGPGRLIARQGKAGSPTYDGWSKVGCATADACWSDTPFTTGTRTVATDLTSKQTMLIESFSVTQAGHGTQVITASDTISVAATAFVIRCTSTSSARLNRVGGVDSSSSTDQGCRTGVDIFVTDASTAGNGVFTPTLADLNSMEAGTFPSSFVATNIVYDVWVMADYCEGCAVAGTSYKHKVRQN